MLSYDYFDRISSAFYRAKRALRRQKKRLSVLARRAVFAYSTVTQAGSCPVAGRKTCRKSCMDNLMEAVFTQG